MPHVPLMIGGWKRMSPAQALLFRQRLEAASHEGVQGAQGLAEGLWGEPGYLPLRCYPGWVLVEAQVATAPGEVGTIDVLYGPGVLALVNGSSELLHSLNEGGWRAAPGAEPLAPALAALDEIVTGPEYLRLFCGAVWGSEGPFTIIEHDHHPLLWGYARDPGWYGRLQPLTVVRDGEDLVARTTVSYGQDLFAARFRVVHGLVEMEDDELIASDAVPLRRHRSPVRDLHAFPTASPES